jgi:hypothetical protein
MMSSRLLKVSEREKEEHARGFLHRVEILYLNMLRWSLDHRGVIMLICLVTFLSTFGLYHLVGRDWIPADDPADPQRVKIFHRREKQPRQQELPDVVGVFVRPFDKMWTMKRARLRKKDRSMRPDVARSQSGR